MQFLRQFQKTIRKLLLLIKRDKIAIVHFVDKPSSQQVLHMSASPEINHPDFLPDMVHYIDNRICTDQRIFAEEHEKIFAKV